MQISTELPPASECFCCCFCLFIYLFIQFCAHQLAPFIPFVLRWMHRCEGPECDPALRGPFQWQPSGSQGPTGSHRVPGFTVRHYTQLAVELIVIGRNRESSSARCHWIFSFCPRSSAASRGQHIEPQVSSLVSL